MTEDQNPEDRIKARLFGLYVKLRGLLTKSERELFAQVAKEIEVDLDAMREEIERLKGEYYCDRAEQARSELIAEMESEGDGND